MRVTNAHEYLGASCYSVGTDLCSTLGAGRARTRPKAILEVGAVLEGRSPPPAMGIIIIIIGGIIPYPENSGKFIRQTVHLGKYLCDR